jgi:hypothetical protein
MGLELELGFFFSYKHFQVTLGTQNNLVVQEDLKLKIESKMGLELELEYIYLLQTSLNYSHH